MSRWVCLCVGGSKFSSWCSILRQYNYFWHFDEISFYYFVWMINAWCRKVSATKVLSYFWHFHEISYHYFVWMINAGCPKVSATIKFCTRAFEIINSSEHIAQHILVWKPVRGKEVDFGCKKQQSKTINNKHYLPLPLSNWGQPKKFKM